MGMGRCGSLPETTRWKCVNLSYGGGIGQTWHFLSQNGQYNAQSKIPTCLSFKGPNQTVQLCAASSSTPKKLGLLNCTKTGTPNYAPVNASQNFSCQSFSRNSVVMAFWSADSSTEYPILASNPVPGMLRTNQHQALLIEEILRHGWPGWLDPVTTPKTPCSKPLWTFEESLVPSGGRLVDLYLNFCHREAPAHASVSLLAHQVSLAIEESAVKVYHVTMLVWSNRRLIEFGGHVDPFSLSFVPLDFCNLKPPMIEWPSSKLTVVSFTGWEMLSSSWFPRFSLLSGL